MNNRAKWFAIAGGVIAALAVIEMIDTEATAWNFASLVIGLVLLVAGLVNRPS